MNCRLWFANWRSGSLVRLLVLETFARHLSHGSCCFGVGAYELSFGTYRLGTFGCAHSLQSFRLECFARRLSVGIPRLETSPEKFRSEIFGLEHVALQCSLLTFAWDCSLGNFRNSVSASLKDIRPGKPAGQIRINSSVWSCNVCPTV